VKKQVQPIRMSLRVLAGKLESGTIDDSERRGLASLLRALGDGKTLDQIFEIKRIPQRPKGNALEQRIFNVEVLRLPIALGGENLSKKDAIAEVAKIHNVEIGTIEDDHKSLRGKEIRKMVKDQNYNPISDDLNAR
jgi:hypothetical protein